MVVAGDRLGKAWEAASQGSLPRASPRTVQTSPLTVTHHHQEGGTFAQALVTRQTNQYMPDLAQPKFMFTLCKQSQPHFHNIIVVEIPFKFFVY
jgi:hypothetical protein